MELEALQVNDTDLNLQTRVRRKSPRREYYVLSRKELNRKRWLDISIVLLTFPILFFIGLITAILIKLDSRGPVFFTQERVGWFGKRFTIYKFRSMRVDAEKNGSKFARQNDNRVTTFGNFMRRYRIDEIPQFWNVLKGDMSVIGPRPEQATFVDFFNSEISRYDLRHTVKPGITGLAQVHQGYTDCKRSTQMKLNYDLFYIKNYSLKLDFLIIYRTLKTILTGFGSR